MSVPISSSYEVGWICAHPMALAVARAMLDEDYGVVSHREIGDNNIYATGRIHHHNVVVACLPAGIDGVCAAATVAQNMIRTFPKIRIGLLVGVGGGIPHIAKGVDIRLGDVVVGRPDGEYGGVIQYAKGKLQQDMDTHDFTFVRKGSLNKPPLLLLNALSMLQAYHETDESQIPVYLEELFERKPKMKEKGYSFPGADQDRLFSSAPSDNGSVQAEGLSHTASSVEDGAEIPRAPRDDCQPVIHYGNIASGDFVVKNAEVRDALRDELGAICVDMEAAGLQDAFPCLVIRGICDYADAFKNDVWRRYAATTAAAYAKEFLSFISTRDVHQNQPIQGLIGRINDPFQHGVQVAKKALEEDRTYHKKVEGRNQIQRERDCLQAFKPGFYERNKDIKRGSYGRNLQVGARPPKSSKVA